MVEISVEKLVEELKGRDLDVLVCSNDPFVPEVVLNKVTFLGGAFCAEGGQNYVTLPKDGGNIELQAYIRDKDDMIDTFGLLNRMGSGGIISNGFSYVIIIRRETCEYGYFIKIED